MAEQLELFDGRWIFAFDGRVLEIFGNQSVQVGNADAVRVHVKQLTVTASGPDKKGMREIAFTGPTGYRHLLRYEDESAWDALQPLLSALREAGARLERPEG